MTAARATIVVGVTGSIACYKACEVVSALRQLEGVAVHVVMTPQAAQFVSPLTFQTLSGHPVYREVFQTSEEWDLLHTSLSMAASLVVICPATMNILGKLAHGICDDLVTSVVFATTAPVLIVPAMNRQMYAHPATQANVATLKRFGYEFLGPTEGWLACGVVGLGHIAAPDAVVQAVRQRLGLRSGARRPARASTLKRRGRQ